MTTTCTCGEQSPHIAARRRTADGYRLAIWSDGAITAESGLALPGVPIARPRTPAAIERERRSAWLFAAEVELYDRDELAALHRAARKVAERRGTPGDLGPEVARVRAPAVPVRWEVLASDRDGRPTCRVGHLPRLTHAGVSLWHESGRYEVMIHQRGALRPTGIAFTTLRDAQAYLVANHTKYPTTHETPALRVEPGASAASE